MDSLSQELQDFLIRLGQNPGSVGHRTAHYIEHLLRLLTNEDEQIIRQYYGLFGTDVVTLDDLASRRGITPQTLARIIEADLRKIAVTPEWQMIRQLTDNH